MNFMTFFFHNFFVEWSYLRCFIIANEWGCEITWRWVWVVSEASLASPAKAGLPPLHTLPSASLVFIPRPWLDPWLFYTLACIGTQWLNFPRGCVDLSYWYAFVKSKLHIWWILSYWYWCFEWRREPGMKLRVIQFNLSDFFLLFSSYPCRTVVWKNPNYSVIT